jgi:hypothetical protein
MQTEKEFKELAQAWYEDDERTISFDVIMELMWRSYNQAIKDSKNA